MKRWEALDEFRGLSVLLLVLLSPFGMFKEVPDFFKHAQGSGFTIADLIAPLFLFAVGVSNRLSFLRRLKDGGEWQAVKHTVLRSLIFICFGLLGELVKYRELRLNWGVLEMIGLSSLIALPFMFLDFKRRLLMGSMLIFIWQLLLSFGYYSTALSYDLGGPLGSMAWSSIILVASGVPDDRENSSSILFDIALVYFLASILGNCFWPINKHLVNLPYLTLSIALSASIFLFLNAKGNFFKIPLLPSFGRNALLFYIWAGLTALFVKNTLSTSLKWNYILVLVLVIFLIDSMLAKFLDAKKIYWKI